MDAHLNLFVFLLQFHFQLLYIIYYVTKNCAGVKKPHTVIEINTSYAFEHLEVLITAKPRTILTNAYQMEKYTQNRMKLNIASWNLRGLRDETKQEMLGDECLRYKIDVLAIQETKIKMEDEKELKTGHKLIIFEQRTTSYGGLGFLIKSSYTENVSNYKSISDRVAVLDLKFSGFPKTINARIINAYGPTLEKAQKNPCLIEDFYAQIQNMIDQTPKNWELFI